MRISDWSSDVCSSDLGNRAARRFPLRLRRRSRAGMRPRGARSRLRAGARRARGRYRLLRRALMLTEINFDSRSEEHTSELQSLMRISYAAFCLKKKKKKA